MEMYAAQTYNPTTLALGVNDTQTSIEVVDSSVFLTPPFLATIGYTFDHPETIKVTNIVGNTLTVERAFENNSRVWDGGTQIARILTAYDYNSVKDNIEQLILGNIGSSGDAFVTTDKFLDSNYVYFVGDVKTDWQVNRYDILNVKTIATGTLNKPSTLLDCQGLTYT